MRREPSRTAEVPSRERVATREPERTVNTRRDEPDRRREPERSVDVPREEREPSREREVPSYHALVIPEGTTIPVRMRTALTSEQSRVEDRVTAEVTEDVKIGGRVVVPEGSELRGNVTAARESGRVKGRARLAVAFDQLVVRGRAYNVRMSTIDVTAPDTHERDAAIIGGSTAVGAIVGGIVKGGKGAKKGAIQGAAAGTAAVLITKGREVEIPAGSRWRLRTRETIRL